MIVDLNRCLKVGTKNHTFLHVAVLSCVETLAVLSHLGVLDGSENLTPLGQRVACMSCDPRLGKVLVLSALFSCVLPILSVAACLTRDPFYNSMQNRALVSKVSELLEEFVLFV